MKTYLEKAEEYILENESGVGEWLVNRRSSVRDFARFLDQEKPQSCTCSNPNDQPDKIVHRVDGNPCYHREKPQKCDHN